MILGYCIARMVKVYPIMWSIKCQRFSLNF